MEGQNINTVDPLKSPTYPVDSKLKESEKFVAEKEKERKEKIATTKSKTTGMTPSEYQEWLKTGKLPNYKPQTIKKTTGRFWKENVPVEVDENGRDIVQPTAADKARELVQEAEGPTEEKLNKLHNSLYDIFSNADKLAERLPEGDLKAWLKLSGLGGYERAKLQMQANIDFHDMAKKLRESIASDTISAYQNGKGQFTAQGMELMRKEAESVARKSPVSTGRLDSLKEQGPTQQALPEMPDEDAKILAKIISGGFATIMQGVAIAKAPTDRSAMIGALMENPGIRIMSGVAPMLASDIAAYEERKRQVEDKNIELYERYNQRVDEAMAQFDAEANAAEREYNQMVVNGIYKNMQRIDKLYGLTIDLMGKENEAMINAEAIRNQEEIFNKGAANEYGLKKMSMAHEIHIESLRAARANQKAGLFDNSQFIQQMLPEAAIYSAPMDTLLKSLSEGTAITDAYPEIGNPNTEAGSINKTALMNAEQMADTIDSMVQDKSITQEQAKKMDWLSLTNWQESRRLKKLDRTIMKEWVKKNINANGEFVVEFTNINEPSFRSLNNELFQEPEIIEGKDDKGNAVRRFNSGDVLAAKMSGKHFVNRRMKDALRNKQRMAEKNPDKAAEKETRFSNELGTVSDTGWFNWFNKE